MERPTTWDQPPQTCSEYHRPMPVTINDIAKHLNLSKSTVSYALNGGPRPVSADVRERVQRAAEELGFRPNPVAQSLATRRTRTLGFVPASLEPDAMTSPLVQVALQTIFRAAHEKEMHLLLPSGFDPRRIEETREHLFAAPIDGLILLLPEETSAVHSLLKRKVPMVGIIAPVGGPVPTVNADNAGGVREALAHVLELGHRVVGLLYDDSHRDTRDRHEAFRSHSARVGLECKPQHMIACGLNHHQGEESAIRILSTSPRPTALICVNDHVAAGAVRAAYRMGLRVPRDLSIVGFDDDHIGRTCVVPLTTIRQPIGEMALAAFDGILTQLRGRPVADQVHACPLIVRESTAPPPTGDL